MTRKTRKRRVTSSCSSLLRIGDQNGWSAKTFTSRISRQTRERTVADRDFDFGVLSCSSKGCGWFEQINFSTFPLHRTHPSAVDLSTIVVRDMHLNPGMFSFLFSPRQFWRGEEDAICPYRLSRCSRNTPVFCRCFYLANSLNKEVKRATLSSREIS